VERRRPLDFRRGAREPAPLVQPPERPPVREVHIPPAIAPGPQAGLEIRELAWAGFDPGFGMPVVGAGSGGALSSIQRQVLAAPAGSVVFSSIPASYSHLLLTATCRSAHTAGGVDLLQLRFNNDNVVNNYSQEVHGNTATAGASETIGGTIMNLGAVVNDTDADTSHATFAQIFVPDYAGTAWYKNVIAQVFTPIGSLTTNLTIYDAGGFWKSPAAVNRIDLFLGGGNNYKTGSIFTLYGVA
jgi:hypothetical protein